VRSKRRSEPTARDFRPMARRVKEEGSD